MRCEIDDRLSENGWAWHSRREAEQWRNRVANRIAFALLDPDEEAGAIAARLAFVDALVDAARAGAIVKGRDETETIEMERGEGRAVRVRIRALRVVEARRRIDTRVSLLS
jgi:glycine/D-amino acid oxidase-like deaminating enzyme